MKHLYLLLTLLTQITYSCNSIDRTVETSRLVPETDIVDRLKYQKKALDTMFNHSKEKLLVLVKLADKKDIVQIKDTIFPDNVETTFNILKDTSGHIVTIYESPYSESGDWNISFIHYFDKDGKTFAFTKQTNFFNSGCTEGVAYETINEYYNKDFIQVSKEYKLMDEKGKLLNKNSCEFSYDEPYSVKPTVDYFTKSLKLNGR